MTNTTNTIDPPIAKGLLRSLARALDPTNNDKDRDTHARRFFKSCELHNVTLDVLKELLAIPTTAPTMPAATERVLGFGKHKGKTLGQVALEDVFYVEWLADNHTSKLMRSAASSTLEWASKSETK